MLRRFESARERWLAGAERSRVMVAMALLLGACATVERPVGAGPGSAPWLVFRNTTATAVQLFLEDGTATRPLARVAPMTAAMVRLPAELQGAGGHEVRLSAVAVRRAAYAGWLMAPATRVVSYPVTFDDLRSREWTLAGSVLRSSAEGTVLTSAR